MEMGMEENVGRKFSTYLQRPFANQGSETENGNEKLFRWVEDIDLPCLYWKKGIKRIQRQLVNSSIFSPKSTYSINASTLLLPKVDLVFKLKLEILSFL